MSDTDVNQALVSLFKNGSFTKMLKVNEIFWPPLFVRVIKNLVYYPILFCMYDNFIRNRLIISETKILQEEYNTVKL